LGVVSGASYRRDCFSFGDPISIKPVRHIIVDKAAAAKAFLRRE
jgi:hypothetical protein